MTIKAIETQYKGYRFRSRLEARWAVFFDAMNWQWQYEVEGYKFDDGTCYLPDFYLPHYDIFIEIKGQAPNRAEIEKAIALGSGSGKAVAVVAGLPLEAETELIHSQAAADDAMRDFLEFAMVSLLNGSYPNETGRMAADAAKQARFEYGESSRTR